MKNNLTCFTLAIILILLSSLNVDAQVYKYNAGNLTDSAGQLTWKKYSRFLNQNIYFGDGGDFTITLSLYSDIGKFIIKKTDGTQLLVFDEDQGTWDFKFPLSVNGVPFTTGGGDVYLVGANHFTNSNIFDDSVIAGIGYFEKFNAWNLINFSGNIISNMNFNKGSLTKIGSISTDSISLITNNQNRIVIDTVGNVKILKSLAVTGIIDATTDIYSGGTVYANLFDGSGANITTLNASNISSGTLDTGRLDSKVFKTNNLDTTRFAETWNTVIDKIRLVGDSNYTILPSDRIVGMKGITAPRIFTLPAANSVIAGYEIMVMDMTGGVTTTNTLTISRAGTDTLNGGTSEIFLSAYGRRTLVSNGIGRWSFDGGLVRLGQPNTFTGINTFSNDVIFSGWQKNQSSNSKDQYEKHKVVRRATTYSPGVAFTFGIAHGISPGSSISSATYQIRDDSTGRVILPMSTYFGTGLTFSFYWYDNDSVYIRVSTGASQNLVQSSDTMKVYLTYTDYQR